MPCLYMLSCLYDSYITLSYIMCNEKGTPVLGAITVQICIYSVFVQGHSHLYNRPQDGQGSDIENTNRSTIAPSEILLKFPSC